MEERTGIRDHACRLENRNAASLTGVREVVSFDENQVVMDTDMGLLTIKGKDPHVSRLTVEKEELELWKAYTQYSALTGRVSGKLSTLRYVINNTGK